MDKLYFYLKEGLVDLRKNKGRTFLTSLGIVIGVYSVVLLMALGEGIKVYINNQFQALGSDVVYILPFKLAQAQRSSVTKRFTDQDLKRLTQTVEGIIVPVTQFSSSIERMKEKINGSIVGTSKDMFPVLNLKVKSGRVFTRSEGESSRRIAVIGSKLKDELFPYSPGTGENITISNLQFKVVGVLEKKGVSGYGGSDLDMFAYIPSKTSQQLSGSKGYLTFYAKPNADNTSIGIISQIKKSLLRTYEEDEFSVSTQEDLVSTIGGILSVVSVVLVGIAAISLLVGGVGIMNIMYVTVTERTREIGIRRALGARKVDIVLQFLVLAILLTGIGGSVGLLLAWATTLVIYQWFPATITPTMPIIALGVSCSIGLLFGVLPARKASSISPLEAIRSE